MPRFYDDSIITDWQTGYDKSQTILKYGFTGWLYHYKTESLSDITQLNYALGSNCLLTLSLYPMMTRISYNNHFCVHATKMHKPSD